MTSAEWPGGVPQQGGSSPEGSRKDSARPSAHSPQCARRRHDDIRRRLNCDHRCSAAHSSDRTTRASGAGDLAARVGHIPTGCPLQLSGGTAARRAYVVVATRIGWLQGNENHFEDAVRTEQEAMQLAADAGARDLRDLDMGAYYAEAGGWLGTALGALGRDACQQRWPRSRRPGAGAASRRPSRAARRAGAHRQSRGCRWKHLGPSAGLAPAERQVQVSLALLKLDPGNITSLNNLAVAEGERGACASRCRGD